MAPNTSGKGGNRGGDGGSTPTSSSISDGGRVSKDLNDPPAENSVLLFFVNG